MKNKNFGQQPLTFYINQLVAYLPVLWNRAILTRLVFRSRFRCLIFLHMVPAPVPYKIVKTKFLSIIFLLKLDGNSLVLTVSELMGWVRNVVLIKCIFGSGKPRGVGISGRRVYEPGEGMGKLVYEQPGNEVDGSCHKRRATLHSDSEQFIYNLMLEDDLDLD